MLAVGDGALGFWKAVRDVFSATAEQRCWWHKIGNVLAALPKSVHPAAKRALAEIYQAEDKTHANVAAKRSRSSSAPNGPKLRRRSSTTWTCCWRLRLPCRALDPPTDHEPNRVDLRDRPAANSGHQGPRLSRSRGRDGVQADRVSPNPVALYQTHPTSYRWSVPAPPSSTANPSNEPRPRSTTRRSTRSLRLPSTGLDYSSAAAEEFRHRLVLVGPSDWARSTPCPDWNVRYLVAHVVGGNRFAVSILGGMDAGDAIDEVMSAPQLGDDALPETWSGLGVRSPRRSVPTARSSAGLTILSVRSGAAILGVQGFRPNAACVGPSPRGRSRGAN